jgi:hypothetical protein
MIMDPASIKRKGDSARLSQFVPKLCPKSVRNIETYLKISNFIEIQNARKTAFNQRNFIIFCALCFSAASLHTVEVRGSSPLSPTIAFPNCPLQVFERVAQVANEEGEGPE